MATNPPDGYGGDDFLEQILSIPAYTGLPADHPSNASDTVSLNHCVSQLGSEASAGSNFHRTLFPLGHRLDNGHEDGSEAGSFAVKSERDAVNNMGSLFPVFDHLQTAISRRPLPHIQQPFQGHARPSSTVTLPQAPAARPRVRARRGQATDPHSIAERLRRERISERIKALQELVPSCNKSDRAAMLDEILDYVKFLRLQVKVLSMSRLGGAGAVAQLVAEIPLQSMQGEAIEIQSNKPFWEKWSNEETECEVVKLMEEDVGSAMQFLQSKSLCIMPVSLASLIYHPTSQSNDSTIVKSESSVPS